MDNQGTKTFHQKGQNSMAFKFICDIFFVKQWSIVAKKKSSNTKIKHRKSKI